MATVTPRYRLIPLIKRVTRGSVIGFAIFSALTGLMRFLIEAFPRVENYAAFLILPAIFFQIAVIWLYTAEELKRQRREYFAETNRCVDCGYKLRGIRDVPGHCPECGKVFKPRP